MPPAPPAGTSDSKALKRLSTSAIISAFPLPSAYLPSSLGAFNPPRRSFSAPASLPSPSSSPPAYSMLPSPAPQPPSDSSLAYLRSLEVNVDSHTSAIAILLAGLVDNAKKRVNALRTLEKIRSERDALLQAEFASQARSRDVLRTARREMALQESWSAEIRSTYSRAEAEGVALDVDGAEEMTLEEWGRIAERKEQSSEEERQEIYRRQLAYLHHSLSLSTARLSSLLSSLSPASSATSASVFTAALAQLHFISLRTTRELASLAAEREAASISLAEHETGRAQEERRAEEWVLESVLGWWVQRKDAERVRGGFI